MELDERFIGPLSNDLKQLEKECGELAGMWNGDNPGRLEDQAHVCNDIIEASKVLRELLDEYSNL